MGTGFRHLINKGYTVEVASWLPQTKKYISKGVTLNITPIHHGKRGYTIYVSKELKAYLDSQDSGIDPERPLASICEFEKRGHKDSAL